MRIRSAVLQEMHRPRPYVDSAPIVVEELELAEPGPRELLVRMEAAGICHSDLSVVDGNRPRPTPMALGHEAAGIVERVGPGASLSPGQRVVLTFLPRCGECDGCALDGLAPCTPGSIANGEGVMLGGGRRLTRDDGSTVHHHLGVSAFATYAVVDERSVVPVDSDVPPDVAATLGCAVLTGGGAVRNAGRLARGERVAVVGLGGVGMAALLTALTVEPSEAIAIDLHPAKLEQARALGATIAVTPAEAIEQGIRADLVVEAAGSVRALETAVAVAATGGRVVTVGLPAPDQRLELSPVDLVGRALTLVGCYLGSAVPMRDIPEYVELWRAGRLPVERLVSGTVALEDINHAMDQLADGTVLRQVITFEDAPA